MVFIQREIRHNRRIRIPQIRLIDENGNQVGVVATRDALQRAESVGLDLVEISPNAQPPVCRIMDYGKYVYEIEKKERDAKKKQKVFDVKEIRLSSKIEEHDYQTKLRNATRFLNRGDKVKVTMFFRGREMTHIDLGEKVLARFVADLEEVAAVEKRMPFENRSLVMILTPKSS